MFQSMVEEINQSKDQSGEKKEKKEKTAEPAPLTTQQLQQVRASFTVTHPYFISYLVMFGVVACC